jgi:hypothetical protein
LPLYGEGEKGRNEEKNGHNVLSYGYLGLISTENVGSCWQFQPFKDLPRSTKFTPQFMK